MKRSSAIFALSIVTALGAGVVAGTVLLKASQTETVVVSTHSLQPFTQIQPTDVKMVSVPRSSGIQGLATTEPDVVGHYLSFAVPQGYPITRGDLNASNSFSSFLTHYVEKSRQTGMLLALPVQSTLSQVVNAGESIALIVPHQDGTGGTTFQTIEPVPVLSVMQPAKGGTPTALLVFVTQQDYNVLAPAILNNNVQVGLIPQNGSFTAPQAIQLAPTPPIQGQAQSTGATNQAASSKNGSPATVINRPPGNGGKNH